MIKIFGCFKIRLKIILTYTFYLFYITLILIPQQARSRDDKKVMSNQAVPSFLRLKFKNNSQRESTQRKRDKREQSRKIKSLIALPEISPPIEETQDQPPPIPKIIITPKPVAKTKSSGDAAKKRRSESERKEGNFRQVCIFE